ncbi:MAG: hypothetical protein P8X89_09180 [Reinekea sp.]
MLPKNWSEPMGTPAIFEKNRNQWLPLCIHSGVTDSGSIRDSIAAQCASH